MTSGPCPGQEMIEPKGIEHMRRIEATTRQRIAAVMIAGFAVLLAAGIAGAQDDSKPASGTELHSNLWLCESLMAEVAAVPLENLEPAPRAVRLERKGKHEGHDLFEQVAFELLDARGYEVYVDEEDTSRQAAVDYVYRYDVKALDFTYPAVGRTLGLWRQWVDRDISIVADLELVEVASGRVLYRSLVQRQFGDRIPAGALDDVRSTAYGFTDPKTGEGGWHRRVEEIVVVGTLAGMVAVYFANTGN